MTAASPSPAVVEPRPYPEPATGPPVVVPAIDGFRGMAALSVLLFHSLMGAGRSAVDEGSIRSILVSGYMGVDFFFVISGFVLFLPTVLKGGTFGNLRAYAVRRAARIIPAYWVLLAVLAVAQPLITTVRTDLPYQSGEGLLSLLLHMTFLHQTVGLVLEYPVGFATHGAVWTLALEATFYALLPLVAAWYYRRPFVGLLLAVAASMAWKLAITWPGSVDPKAWDYWRIVLIIQLPTYLAHFAAGMTGAWVFVRVKDWVTGRARRAAALAVQVTAAAGVLAGMRYEGMRDLLAVNGIYDHFTRPVYIAFLFAVLLAATGLAPPWAQLPFANRLSRRLGDISYGVYLWHLMFIGFAVTTLDWVPDASNWAFARMLAFALPLSLLAGWLSMVLVERPAIRWARKRSAAISRRAARAPRRDAGASLAPL